MRENNRPLKVFATSGTVALTEKVCAHLKSRLPLQIQPGKVILERFSNENIQVQVDNVRGHVVVVIHSQVPPVSEGLIELDALLDAIVNARAANVMLVFPYMPYSRSDRKNKPRISVMSKQLAKKYNLVFGVNNVLLLDPHETHIKHYFDPAADEISAVYLAIDDLERNYFLAHPKENCTVVFADAGAAKRYDRVPHILKVQAAYIDKDRPDDKEAPVFNKIVGDIRGRHCILIDDEILSGGTAIGDAEILKEGGAISVTMVAIHAILADKKRSNEELIARLEQSCIDEFIVTDSIPCEQKLELAQAKKFRVLSVAPLLAEAISRTVQDGSLTALHDPDNVGLYRS